MCFRKSQASILSDYAAFLPLMHGAIFALTVFSRVFPGLKELFSMAYQTQNLSRFLQRLESCLDCPPLILWLDDLGLCLLTLLLQILFRNRFWIFQRNKLDIAVFQIDLKGWPQVAFAFLGDAVDLPDSVRLCKLLCTWCGKRGHSHIELTRHWMDQCMACQNRLHLSHQSHKLIFTWLFLSWIARAHFAFFVQ